METINSYVSDTYLYIVDVTWLLPLVLLVVFYLVMYPLVAGIAWMLVVRSRRAERANLEAGSAPEKGKEKAKAKKKPYVRQPVERYVYIAWGIGFLVHLLVFFLVGFDYISIAWYGGVEPVEIVGTVPILFAVGRASLYVMVGLIDLFACVILLNVGFRTAAIVFAKPRPRKAAAK